MNGGRFASFITLVLTVWALMHWYVFWRLGTIPWMAAHSSHGSLVFVALGLGLSYPLARTLNARKLEVVGAPLEFARERHAARGRHHRGIQPIAHRHFEYAVFVAQFAQGDGGFALAANVDERDVGPERDDGTVDGRARLEPGRPL